MPLVKRWALIEVLVNEPSGPEPPEPPPRPMAVALGNGYNRPERLFGTVEADMVRVAEVFTHVNLSPASPREKDAAAAAGLGIILEFDYKWEFAAGTAIDQRVSRVMDEIDQDRDRIVAVHVADRLNSWAIAANDRPAIPPATMVGYLEATGGRFHKELPGLAVLVDVEDHTVTCGLPGQMRCGSAGPMYAHENTATLQMLAGTGHVDGLVIADNLATTGSNPWDPGVQAEAWHTLRGALPPPLTLLPRTSRVSFTEGSFLGDLAEAHARVECGVSVPLAMGAQGAELWGWHIPFYSGQGPNTWLNKDANSNWLWEQMAAATARLRS